MDGRTGGPPSAQRSGAEGARAQRAGDARRGGNTQSTTNPNRKPLRQALQCHRCNNSDPKAVGKVTTIPLGVNSEEYSLPFRKTDNAMS